MTTAESKSGQPSDQEVRGALPSLDRALADATNFNKLAENEMRQQKTISPDAINKSQIAVNILLLESAAVFATLPPEKQKQITEQVQALVWLQFLVNRAVHMQLTETSTAPVRAIDQAAFNSFNSWLKTLVDARSELAGDDKKAVMKQLLTYRNVIESNIGAILQLGYPIQLEPGAAQPTTEEPVPKKEAAEDPKEKAPVPVEGVRQYYLGDELWMNINGSYPVPFRQFITSMKDAFGKSQEYPLIIVLTESGSDTQRVQVSITEKQFSEFTLMGWTKEVSSIEQSTAETVVINKKTVRWVDVLVQIEAAQLNQDVVKLSIKIAEPGNNDYLIVRLTPQTMRQLLLLRNKTLATGWASSTEPTPPPARAATPAARPVATESAPTPTPPPTEPKAKETEVTQETKVKANAVRPNPQEFSVQVVASKMSPITLQLAEIAAVQPMEQGENFWIKIKPAGSSVTYEITFDNKQWRQVRYWDRLRKGEERYTEVKSYSTVDKQKNPPEMMLTSTENETVQVSIFSLATMLTPLQLGGYSFMSVLSQTKNGGWRTIPVQIRLDQWQALAAEVKPLIDAEKQKQNGALLKVVQDFPPPLNAARTAGVTGINPGDIYEKAAVAEGPLGLSEILKKLPNRLSELKLTLGEINGNTDRFFRVATRYKALVVRIHEKLKEGKFSDFKQLTEEEQTELALQSIRLEFRAFDYLKGLPEKATTQLLHDPERARLFVENNAREYLDIEEKIFNEVLISVQLRCQPVADKQQQVAVQREVQARSPWDEVGTNWLSWTRGEQQDPAGMLKQKEEFMAQLAEQYSDAISIGMSAVPEQPYYYFHTKVHDRTVAQAEAQRTRGVNEAQDAIIKQFKDATPAAVRGIPTGKLRESYAEFNKVGQEVKIHLMPRVNQEPLVVARLLALLQRRSDLRDRVQPIKVRIVGNGKNDGGEILPEVVLYTTKDSYPIIVAALMQEFQDIQGTNRIPRFNEPVKSENGLIYVAQSGGDFKNQLAQMGLLNKIFDQQSNHARLRV